MDSRFDWRPSLFIRYCYLAPFSLTLTSQSNWIRPSDSQWARLGQSSRSSQSQLIRIELKWDCSTAFSMDFTLQLGFQLRSWWRFNSPIQWHFNGIGIPRADPDWILHLLFNDRIGFELIWTLWAARISSNRIKSIIETVAPIQTQASAFASTWPSNGNQSESISMAKMFQNCSSASGPRPKAVNNSIKRPRWSTFLTSAKLSQSMDNKPIKAAIFQVSAKKNKIKKKIKK